MGRSFAFLLMVGAAAAGWYTIQHYEVRGLEDLAVIRRDGTGSGLDRDTTHGDGSTIRITSFNLQNLDPAKAANNAVMEVIARIIREFDLVAIQGVTSSRPDVLRSLLDHVNDGGGRYSALVGPTVGQPASQEQYVYVFDQGTIETDRASAYTVDDPDGLLHSPPFVGWFRALGPAPDKAFTFTLVNVHTNADETEFELRQLDSVFYAVRDDGRGEDDLIMLGDFNADDRQLMNLEKIPHILAAISDTPTNTQQSAQYDNLLFQLSATSEYAGRSGVFDFLRKFNLTLDQALQVSDHLPVWAEFSIYEGGDNPAIAAAGGAAPRR